MDKDLVKGIVGGNSLHISLGCRFKKKIVYQSQKKST